MFEVSFHGAAGTVTGSKHLLRVGDTRVLLDAGMFQGFKALRKRNWQPPGFDPKSVDHVLLSHTHIDYVGFLPRLVKLGLNAPVHCTPAAYALSELMLLDSAKIQEEDAKRANRKGYSRHKVALPLYTADDAKAALELRHALDYDQWLTLDKKTGLRARFHNAGHLLGSAFIELRVPRGDGQRDLRVVFSGDIGRYDVPLHLDPDPLPPCDMLIMESTYGDRLHTDVPLVDQMAEPFSETLGRGGIVLIPAFAVGRSQQITLILRRLMRAGSIPRVPIHIDSPMAVNATKIYSQFLDPNNVDADVFEDGRLRLFPKDVHFHRSVADSKRLNKLKGPRIIVSASGMLSGGRVLHHLPRIAEDRRNLIMLVGYQAPGTRARDLLDGATAVRVHGRWVQPRCDVISLRGLSGHGDRNELLDWVGSCPEKPKLTFLVHGEPTSSRALAHDLRTRHGMRVHTPQLEDTFDVEAELAKASR